MFRTLILLIAIGLIVWVVKQMLKNKSAAKAKPPGEIKNIVQCKQCKVYIPQDQAVKENNDFFCSQQHLTEWKNED